MSESVKDNKKEEVNEKSDTNESINNIVVKPIVDIDINIEDLEVGSAPTLGESK